MLDHDSQFFPIMIASITESSSNHFQFGDDMGDQIEEDSIKAANNTNDTCHMNNIQPCVEFLEKRAQSFGLAIAQNGRLLIDKRCVSVNNNCKIHKSQGDVIDKFENSMLFPHFISLGTSEMVQREKSLSLMDKLANFLFVPDEDQHFAGVLHSCKSRFYAADNHVLVIQIGKHFGVAGRYDHGVANSCDVFSKIRKNCIFFGMKAYEV